MTYIQRRDLTALLLFSLSSAFFLRVLLFPDYLLIDVPLTVSFLRKLPWLSRQSDRLLTDRSLVRSQAEASFLLFLFSAPFPF